MEDKIPRFPGLDACPYLLWLPPGVTSRGSYVLADRPAAELLDSMRTFSVWVVSVRDDPPETLQSYGSNWVADLGGLIEQTLPRTPPLLTVCSVGRVVGLMEIARLR